MSILATDFFLFIWSNIFIQYIFVNLVYCLGGSFWLCIQCFIFAPSSEILKLIMRKQISKRVMAFIHTWWSYYGMLVEKRVRLSGHLVSNCVCVREARHHMGITSCNGGIGLCAWLRRVWVHELSQRIKTRIQELCWVQRWGRDVDRRRADKRWFGLCHMRLTLQLWSNWTRSATEGLLWPLDLFVGGFLLLVPGNQPC